MSGEPEREKAVGEMAPLVVAIGKICDEMKGEVAAIVQRMIQQRHEINK